MVIFQVIWCLDLESHTKYWLRIFPWRTVLKKKATHVDINRAWTWTRHLYILDPKLHDGKEIPKWEKWSTTSIFMGFYHTHSSLISLVFNINTGSVTPQFHVIHDELFTTVLNFGANNLDALYDRWYIISRHNYYEPDIDNFGKYPYYPSVSKLWINDDEIKVKREQKRLRFRHLYGREYNSIFYNDLIEPISISPLTSSVPDFNVQSPLPSTSTLSYIIEYPVLNIKYIDKPTKSPSSSPNN